jgi:L-lactate dehydrogenase
VGATFAYALAGEARAEEIVLTDLSAELAEGQVLDLAHGLPYLPPVRFRAGDAEDYQDAQVIVITAGASQKPGETRLDLLQRNAGIVESIMRDIVEQDSPATVVVVTNPVDVLTRVAVACTDWPRGRIIGSGTVLDTARLRYILSRHFDVDARNVHAYVLGEHGDSEIAAWSLSHIAGMPIDDYNRRFGDPETWERAKYDIQQQVRGSAYHIIDYKGATSFAIGLALVRVVGAIFRGERSVLTVSARVEGEYGLRDVCLGVPCLTSGQGVERIIEGRLSESEADGLAHSAEVLQRAWESLGRSSGGS